MKIFVTLLTGFQDPAPKTEEVGLFASSLLAAGDEVVEMVARIFGMIVGVTSAVMAGTSSASTSTSVESQSIAEIRPGGAVSFDVPGNLALSVFLDLKNVSDEQGSIASFRLNAYRYNQLVETQRVTMLEPGSEVIRVFRRPFHVLEIADGEGTVSGSVMAVGFCTLQMIDRLTCREKDADPTPARMVTEAISAVPVASENSASAAEDDSSTSGTSAGATSPGADDLPDDEDDIGEGTDDGDTPQPISDEYFGELTPITRLTSVSVQGAPGAGVSYRPTTPWLDQAKLTKSWIYKKRTVEELAEDKVGLNKHQMPIMPAGHSQADGYIMDGGYLWFGSKKEGSSDLAGTWVLRAPEGVALAPRAFDMDISYVSDREARVTCTEGADCRLMIAVSSTDKDSGAPELIQMYDKNGRPLTDLEDRENGLVTRSSWRKSMYGYTDLRMMHYSGATAPTAMPIRFDHFPEVEDASWSNTGFFVPFRTNPSKEAKPGLTDLKTGKGMKKVFSPVEARVRAAYEIGAVYHHNFPPLFLEDKESVDPVVIGQWAIDLFARTDLTVEEKQSLFNDYELQHVDEFGALVAENQGLLTRNQVKLEIGNEIWNHSWPYMLGNDYYTRKADKSLVENGWGTFPAGAPKNAVQLGYDLTKTIARLRKTYPQIEWRGVMAVQTFDRSKSRSGSRPAPDTPSGYYNRFLRGMIIGYEFFWQDYAQNEAEWSELYAAEPSKPGDWFEAQGTTYYRVEAKRADLKSHIGGIAPEDLMARAADESQWPALRQEILEWFISPDHGALNGEHGEKTSTSDLYMLTTNFIALAEHAAAYGMQVTSYEGGSHARLGSYYYKRKDLPDYMIAFWRNFHDSVENALIQAAVHDAAINAGWMGLADFKLFQGDTDSTYIFGTRKSFEDITPRFCEYARWMPAEVEPPVGVNALDVVHPQEKCGSLIDYLNQAKANGYYTGQPIAEASSFLK